MRYSLAVAALAGTAFASSTLPLPVNQISDGQVQVQTSAPSPTTAAPVEEETVLSTKEVIVTSCAPEIVSCPANYHTTSKIVVPVPKITSTPAAPVQVATTAAPVAPVKSSVTPVEVASVTPAAPVESSVTPVEVASSAAPVVPVVSSPVSPVEVATSAAPVVPVAPASSACPTCPTCPAAVTVVQTVTVTPSPAASTPVVGSPSGAGSPSQVASTLAPPAGSPPAGTAVPPVPGSPAPVGGSPAGGAPVGTASGVASGTGAVPKPTSSPIQAFKGAASTTGSSMAIAGLAAFAAIFLA